MHEKVKLKVVDLNEKAVDLHDLLTMTFFGNFHIVLPTTNCYILGMLF